MGYSESLGYPDNNFYCSKHRKLSPAYACAELLWYLSGSGDLEFIKAYAPSYEDFSDGFGVYGPRLGTQLGDVAALLREDKYTRRAVVALWRADDLGEQDKRDLPCTLSLQFLRRPSIAVTTDKLHLVVTMRSNDAWRGLPYDLFCFTCIQIMMAQELGLLLGEYHHHASSMHLYDRDRAKAMQCWQDTKQPAYHDWKYYASFAEVPAMLALELGARQNGEVDEEAFSKLSPMAQDLVACCARRWGCDLPLNSALLETAHAHHRGT